MANKNTKTPKNVAGKYYVDDSCISCGQCREIAPDNFAEDAGSGMMYVQKQPATAEAATACENAVESCPVSAIGNDGE